MVNRRFEWLPVLAEKCRWSCKSWPTRLQAVVANRYIMREIPRLLHQFDAKITHTIGDVVLEIGNGEYFPSLAKNYGPFSAGFAIQSEFEQWIAAIDRALSENTFFGSCNYVTYGMTKAN